MRNIEAQANMFVYKMEDGAKQGFNETDSLLLTTWNQVNQFENKNAMNCFIKHCV